MCYKLYCTYNQKIRIKILLLLLYYYLYQKINDKKKNEKKFVPVFVK